MNSSSVRRLGNVYLMAKYGEAWQAKCLELLSESKVDFINENVQYILSIGFGQNHRTKTRTDDGKDDVAGFAPTR